MAAGFSLKTKHLEDFISEIQTASKEIDTAAFVRERRVDAVIPLNILNMDLYKEIEQFAPFGLGNPRPVFASTDVDTTGAKRVGKDFSHLKFVASGFESIYFQAPPELVLPAHLSRIVYSLDLNTYNGFERLQLLVKEVHGTTA